jgi:hypothetical protein
MATNLTAEGRKKSLQKRINTVDDNKRIFLAALEKSLGIVSTAAVKCKMHRSVHYIWMAEDPDYKAAVEEIQEHVLDVVESELHKNIKAGSDTATIFFLKTKGKKRGYIERSELDITGQMALQWSEIKTYEGNEVNSQADPGAGRPGG